MKLKCLGSGSKGNCYILENKEEAFIIEAGISFLEVKKALGFNILKIVGVAVSHCHMDHAKYLAEYEKAGIPTYKPYEETKACPFCIQYGNFRIQAFRLVHDVPCYGFYITHPAIGKSIYISDTELVKFRFDKLNLNHILVEANYSEDLLTGEEMNYEHVKRGHMSLETCLKFLETNDNQELKNVVLLHLSEKNSDETLFLKEARKTVKHGTVFIAKKGLEVDVSLLPF